MSVRKRKPAAAARDCPMAACMAVLGGAWTTSVIWKLSVGPRRFGELYKNIHGISPKMLSARLHELEKKGVVIREVTPTSPPAVEYSLSARGRELIPVINAIVRAGIRLNEPSTARSLRKFIEVGN